MGIVIGIDIGGSNTKIAGFNGGRELMPPLFINASDQTAAAYAAFGKFVAKNSLQISDIEKIAITGVGSTFISDPMFQIKTVFVEEMRAIGVGGLYLSGLEEAVVVSMGTGTAMVHARGEGSVHIGGTGIGGGTLRGLSRRLLDMDDINHISELAKSGDLSRIDLRFSDMVKRGIIPGLPAEATTSNFGKRSDLATKADIALGIINLVFETIGVTAQFAASCAGIRDVVFTGIMTSIPQAAEILMSLGKMLDIHFIIPEHAQFGTAIGAALI